MASDPLRMYLVVRRGAFDALSPAAELAGAAAVACVRNFANDPVYVDAFACWRPRPGKVCLRARGGQWPQALGLDGAVAGDPATAAVLALPPRPRSGRGPLLERMQAMSSDLAPAPGTRSPDDDRDAVTYLLNPRAPMSSGKTLAQIAHAAVMAAERASMHGWAAAGCPGRVLAPSERQFEAAASSRSLVAEVVDAGLTELPPGTCTVRALAP
jgi:Peptidyl-tRNA hydrolase PTH2